MPPAPKLVYKQDGSRPAEVSSSPRETKKGIEIPSGVVIGPSEEQSGPSAWNKDSRHLLVPPPRRITLYWDRPSSSSDRFSFADVQPLSGGEEQNVNPGHD